MVQEALTNVLKHATPANCQVLIDVTTDAVTVEVRDDGRTATTTISGHGIAGMRERVTMFGGHLAAGPGPAGGWLVTARLPTSQRQPENHR